MLIRSLCVLLALQLAACSSSQAKVQKDDSGRNPTQNQTPKPKYGPEATLLSQSHQYIQTHPAPDYWAISPYYLAQQDDRSCSVAAAAMIVNAARMGKKLTADDKLATQADLVKQVNDAVWTRGVGPGGHGVSLDELKTIMEESLKAYGVERFFVTAVHMNDMSAESRATLHKALSENEKSAHNFIIANFIQGVFTGDADVGHFAPVGAYDLQNHRVLIMDPDREWYEPYWVSEATFAKGMATKDGESGKSRGYLLIKIEK